VASSWILFFNYQDDARSNTHQKINKQVRIHAKTLRGVRIFAYWTLLKYLYHLIHYGDSLAFVPNNLRN